MHPYRMLPRLFAMGICITGLLLYPSYTASGIKNGLLLLGENIIPSLFPFMVLSTYISQSPITDFISKMIDKPSRKIWNVNGNGMIAVILGLLGGYPIGAKTVAEFYNDGKVSQQEASKLMNWCVNPSPAFAITALGTFMLGNTFSGVILYVSSLLSTLYISIFTRFFNSIEIPKAAPNNQTENRGNLLIKSVSVGGEAMLSICGWVLTFSAVASLLDAVINIKGLRLFLQSISEVTNGCDICTRASLPLPAISAVIGFGGLAVIAQVSPYLNKCGVSIKQFICWRIVNGALSAFFCSGLLKLFPQSVTVFSDSVCNSPVPSLSNGASVAVVLLLMCLVFIFEVDNKRKIC